MAAWFIDTSGWACHFDRSQVRHTAAVNLIGAAVVQGCGLVTTNYVLAELISLLTTRSCLSRSQVVQCVQTIETANYVNVVHIDPALDDEAGALLQRRLDKDWSLVDCASFAVMQRQGLTEALTTDRHFEQAGFIRLLGP